MFSAKKAAAERRKKSWKQRIKRTMFLKKEAALLKKNELFQKGTVFFTERTGSVDFQPSS
jgi:siroheme synthase (precorrin-2 oxidase/ferrochelatase)